MPKSNSTKVERLWVHKELRKCFGCKERRSLSGVLFISRCKSSVFLCPKCAANPDLPIRRVLLGERPSRITRRSRFRNLSPLPERTEPREDHLCDGQMG